MSMFDKLKAYSRKPAAVILATVMATSTIPTTPIAQAVTAAYAAESTTTQKSGETKTQSFDPSSLVSDVPLKYWEIGEPLTLDASKYIKNQDGSLVKARVEISKTQIIDYISNKLHYDQSLDSLFKYTPGGEDSYSRAVDGALKKKSEELKAKNLDDKDKTVTYSDAVLSGDISRNVEDCAFKVIGPDGKEVKPEGDRYFITADTTLNQPGKVTFEVESVTLSLSFDYEYTTTTTTKSNTDNKPDGGGEKTDDGLTSTEQSGESGGNQPIVSGPIHGEDTLKATVDNIDVKSNNIKYTSGDITVNEIYAGVSDKIPATYTIDEKDCPTYKTDHDAYTVLSDLPKGITGKVENNNKEFKATLATSAADESQAVKIETNEAFSDAKSFTITWLYPDGVTEAGKTIVTLPKVNRKPIDTLKIDPQDFRIQSKQEENVKSLANAALNGEIAKFNKEDGDKVKDKKYFTNASFKTYDTQGAAQDLEVSYETDNSGVYKNYEIRNPDSVHVNALAEIDWADDNIVLHSIHNEDNKEIDLHASDHGTWVKQAPTASWKNHSLTAATVVPETADGFKGWTAPNTNGKEHVEALYALDDETGVVVKVNVAYSLDTKEPTLNSVEYKGARTKHFDNILFSHKSFDVDYALGSGLSGINGDASWVNYHDNKSGKDETNVALTKSKNGASNSFTIAGDREVDTKNIKIHAVSVAGVAKTFSASENEGVPSGVTKLVAESSGPQVAISYSDTNPQRTANGKDYYNHTRSVRITVTDPFFKYTRQYAPQTICEITRDGANFATITTGDDWHQGSNADEWYVDVQMTADGDYVVGAASICDVIGGEGHSSSADGEEFVVDTTAPKLNVSWNTEAAQNGKYYNAARTATITVEEHNFDPNLFKIEAPVSAGNGDEATPAQIGGWSSNGDTHTATVTFPGQGVYTLSVSGEDLASNKSESYTSPEFVIDTIKPKIDIQNVVNRTAYAGEVAPTAAVHDTNLADGTSIEVSKISYPLSKDDPNPYAGVAINTSATDKSVSYLNPAKTKGNDGVYTLTVQAVDLAGNTESEAVTWSVNRFGSTYVISDNTGKMLDQYLKSAKTTDVKVTEINPSGLDDNKTSVELTRDTKNTTLKSGDNYTTDADTTSGWSEYNYTVSKSNYDKDGAYRVLFHSEDAAGNSSENTMEGKNAKKSGAAAEINFAVDDTAPIASFVDLASNGKYEESSHKAKVSFEDNLKLSKAQIKVNGKTVATFTADQLEKSPIREFTLDGSSSKQDVSVVAWDAAGNKSKELKATGVLVTNDSFVLWMNNLPLMVGTIVAIVVVAGGIYLVVAKKRKENEEK